jgi:hypothetical protein
LPFESFLDSQPITPISFRPTKEEKEDEDRRLSRTDLNTTTHRMKKGLGMLLNMSKKKTFNTILVDDNASVFSMDLHMLSGAKFETKTTEFESPKPAAVSKEKREEDDRRLSRSELNTTTHRMKKGLGKLLNMSKKKTFDAFNDSGHLSFSMDLAVPEGNKGKMGKTPSKLEVASAKPFQSFDELPGHTLREAKFEPEDGDASGSISKVEFGKIDNFLLERSTCHRNSSMLPEPSVCEPDEAGATGKLGEMLQPSVLKQSTFGSVVESFEESFAYDGQDAANSNEEQEESESCLTTSVAGEMDLLSPLPNTKGRRGSVDRFLSISRGHQSDDQSVMTMEEVQFLQLKLPGMDGYKSSSSLSIVEHDIIPPQGKGLP